MADESQAPQRPEEKGYQVPAPMEEGDPRSVPPVGETTSPNPDTTPAEPQPAVTEEQRERAELPEGMEYVSDKDEDGVTFTSVPWPGY